MADFEHILLNILENKRAKNLENGAKCAYKPIFSYSIKNSILSKMSLTTFLHSADDLFSTLSSSEERKRHNLAMEKLQHDRDNWNQERLQRIDYINGQLKKQGHAERAFASADDAMGKYYELTGVLLDPVPPEPQLFDYLEEDQTKTIQNGELTLIGLGMLGTGVLMYNFL